jgi:hypothetical protein
MWKRNLQPSTQHHCVQCPLTMYIFLTLPKK